MHGPVWQIRWIPTPAHLQCWGVAVCMESTLPPCCLRRSVACAPRGGPSPFHPPQGGAQEPPPKRPPALHLPPRTLAHGLHSRLANGRSCPPPYRPRVKRSWQPQLLLTPGWKTTWPLLPRGAGTANKSGKSCACVCCCARLRNMSCGGSWRPAPRPSLGALCPPSSHKSKASTRRGGRGAEVTAGKPLPARGLGRSSRHHHLEGWSVGLVAVCLVAAGGREWRPPQRGAKIVWPSQGCALGWRAGLVIPPEPLHNLTARCTARLDSTAVCCVLFLLVAALYVSMRKLLSWCGSIV
jgi:hypothetical protein